MYLEDISTEQLVMIAVMAALGALIVTYVCYVSAYRTHKNEKAEQEQKALLEGSTLPEYELQKVENWWNGYKLAGIVIAVFGVICGFAAVTVVGESCTLAQIPAMAVALIGSLIGGLLIDKYVVHPIADNQFYEKVENPLVEQFLSAGDEDDTEASGEITLAELKDLILAQQKENADIKKRMGLQ